MSEGHRESIAATLRMKTKFLLRPFVFPVLLISVLLLPVRGQTLPDAVTGENWMGFVPDSTSLFQMSLPGTHESMARFPEPLTDRGRAFFNYNFAPVIRNNIPDSVESAYREAICDLSLHTRCHESIRDILTNDAFDIFKGLHLDSIVRFYATCQQA